MSNCMLVFPLYLRSLHSTTFIFQVYIIGHVPPGYFEKKRSKAWFRPEFNQRYVDMVRKHHSVIQGQFFGHHHTDSFRMFYDSDGTDTRTHLMF